MKGGGQGDFLLPRMLDLARVQTGWIIVFSRETCYLFAARRDGYRLSRRDENGFSGFYGADGLL